MNSLDIGILPPKRTPTVKLVKMINSVKKDKERENDRYHCDCEAMVWQGRRVVRDSALWWLVTWCVASDGGSTTFDCGY